jgi:uncharacterized protein YqhQ
MAMKFKRFFKLFLPTLLFSVTKPLVGGQAVIEGVMMRSPNSLAVAVRRKNGNIVVKEHHWLSFFERARFLRWPLVRGATMLVESMYNGLSALQFSAEQAALDLEDTSAAEPSASKQGDKSGKNSKKALDYALLGMMALSMLMGILLFKGLPHMLAWGIGEWFSKDGVSALPMDSAWFHLVDGGIKMALFVGYILLISRMPDVGRLFMYHGAEHKSVHAFEQSKTLDVDGAALMPVAHPRCGTTLILLVISTSILVFAATLPFVPKVSESSFLQALFSLAIKVPLMLPIAGIAYEFQRAAAKHPDWKLIQAFIRPGMLMQSLTTREPSADQLEVAMSALRKSLWREEQSKALPVAVPTAASPLSEQEVYADFAAVCANT